MPLAPGGRPCWTVPPVINEYVPDDAPLAWLDHKFPKEVDGKEYGQGYQHLLNAIRDGSAVARKIMRTKYWDADDDVNIATQMNPESGYWGLTVGFRYVTRLERRSREQRRRNVPDWELGAYTKMVYECVEVPDDVLHAAIMKVATSHRRALMKQFCSSDFYALSEDVNPDGPYLDELKTFVRNAYERLMQGQVHCAYGLDAGAPPPEERMAPARVKRQDKRGKK